MWQSTTRRTLIPRLQIIDRKGSLLCTSTKTQVLTNHFPLFVFADILLLDGASKGFAGQYESFAKENKGMFRIGSVDCNQFESICKKEKVEKLPLLRIYPAFPAPT